MADKGKRPRSSNWSEKDRIILVQCIFEMEDNKPGSLFGKFKGSGRDVKARNDAWEHITRRCNAEFDVPRDRTQLQKQYDNLKTKAKEHLDEQKLPKTGGGPPPKPPSSSVQLLLTRLGDKPNMTGLGTGLDTEESELPSENDFKLSSIGPLFGSPKRVNIPSSAPLSISNSDNVAPSKICGTTSDNIEDNDPTTRQPSQDKSNVHGTRISDSVVNETSNTVRRQRSIDSVEASVTTLHAGSKTTNKRKRTSCSTTGCNVCVEEEWIMVERDRAKAETEKVKKELELLDMRMKHEAELFEIKKAVLKAKLNYYSNK